jgi:hypothetical protein
MGLHATGRTSDEGTAVMAHGLLSSMSVVSGGIMTVWDHWADLSPAGRDHLFERILAHATIVTEALKDLTHGLPEDVEAELDDLQRRRPRVQGAPEQ